MLAMSLPLPGGHLGGLGGGAGGAGGSGEGMLTPSTVPDGSRWGPETGDWCRTPTIVRATAPKLSADGFKFDSQPFDESFELESSSDSDVLE